mmetsp:Transcript_31483/g.51342  ORF Transcript_31483/g.51342 Transcript_31483/m.51342 type:complete len:346 (+) Transcript_31483:67-1104(+)|eukprot:CAMPEP_0206370316 /NCGR_PEP_ID=MMETSP0294-20121207/5832_1 /ASSEMBLY_ACC=CAM_ASM_000327 /TAXON_ID=39354 /ORGANISM="Heterosigma akashiwo, Strain CCMP2393" /LENGTH=345 /DNA_ID=CAMNT_0053817263 /DNA_START=62 /DNA_END=1099 /DNA_ORIENTATION=+
MVAKQSCFSSTKGLALFALFFCAQMHSSFAFISKPSLLPTKNTPRALGVVTPSHSRGLENSWRGSSSALLMARDEDENDANFLTAIIAGAILALYLGTIIVPGVQDIQGGLNQGTVKVEGPDGTTKNVGVYTSMSRVEIQKKLSQVPVFYVETKDGAVAVEGGQGQFFVSAEGAKARLAELRRADPDVRLAAATLDQVWYPLVAKKAKAGRFLEGVVGRSDPAATYVLVPGTKAIQSATSLSSDFSASKVPVFYSPKLQFKGEAGAKNQVPLFLSQEDLQTTWERLRQIKSNQDLPEQAQLIQLADMNAVLAEMEGGGNVNARQFEFYPSMVDIEAINEIYGFGS